MASFADFLFQARIIACTANPRNGKTRMMVDMIKDLNDQGIDCYPDFHVAGVNCDKIIPGQLPIDYPEDPHYLPGFRDIKDREFPKGSVLFLDELIKEFDNRLTVGSGKEETRTRAELTQAFMQIGKKHLRVVHAEQITRTIDWRIAYLSEMFLVPRPIAYKIIDNEVLNVEFDITPVVNEGIFGFREMPHYYMDEERFWYYAFEYDSDEPVMSEKEKLEARDLRIKNQRLEQERLNHEKNVEKKKSKQSVKGQIGYLKGQLDKAKLKQLGQQSDNGLDDTAQQGNATNDPENDKVLAYFRKSIDSPIGESDQKHSGHNENIASSQWQSRNKIEPFTDRINNISESQFYQWLGSLVRAG